MIANPVYDDGFYVQFFVVKNGVRINLEPRPLLELTSQIANSVCDGIENIIEKSMREGT